MKKSIKILLIIISLLGFLSLSAIALGAYGFSEYLPEIIEDVKEFINLENLSNINDIKQIPFEKLTDEDIEFASIINKIEEKLPKSSEISNIIIFGMDSYSNDSYQKARSDSIMILTSNGCNNTIKLASIMRDTLVYIPQKDDYNRVNTALVYEKSIDDAIDIIEDLLDTKIDNYIIINYLAVIELIDDLGGVSVYINDEEIKWLNEILLSINKMDTTHLISPLINDEGYQPLDGKQALAYMRIRKKGGDFVRVNRQKEIVQLIYKKVLKMDKLSIMNMLSKLEDNTINNLTLSQMVMLLKCLNNMDNKNFESIILPLKDSYTIGRYKNMSVIIAESKKIAQDFKEFIEKQ